MHIRMIVMEGSEAARVGITQILHHHPQIQIAAMFASIQDTLSYTEQSQADVVLLSGNKGTKTMLGVVNQLTLQRPNSHLMMMAEAWNRDKFKTFSKRGVLGFICNNDKLTTILPLAITQVKQGELYLSPLTVKAVMEGNSQTNPFNHRHTQVLRLMAQGDTPQEIAMSLGISVGAVYAIQHRIRIALNVRTNTQIVREAQLRGWVDVEEN